MNLSLKCLRCDCEMEQGFVNASTHPSNKGLLTWHQEGPKRAAFGGPYGRLDDGFPVNALHCPECGYIELRAADASAGK